MAPEEEALVAKFTGTCHECGLHIDGRRDNVAWNPIKGLSHRPCPKTVK